MFPLLVPALLLLSLAQIGCQSTATALDLSDIDAATVERIKNDPALTVVESEIKVAFATGRLTLISPGWASGAGAAYRSGMTHDRLKLYYKDQLWPLVVNLIAEQNFGDDLHYYLLGYSAEQLGYLSAAAIYYEQSIAQSDRPMRGKCISCMSIRLPDRAIAGLERVTHRLDTLSDSTSNP